MKTEIVSAHDCAKAIELLRTGEVVALPTETVYGLAADALDPSAVAKIFEAKARPRFDPLIVHLPDRATLDGIAVVQSRVACELMAKFWPGPLTFIFSKREIVPDITTAGLETVAVRVSAHPIFREVITALNRPLAAPSANRFGRISPTNAQHVWDELNGRIPLIVDGGATDHGIESTIVRITNGMIEVLRRGPITEDMLRAFGEVREQTSGTKITAPGQLPTHYAPRTKLKVVASLRNFWPADGMRVGLLSFCSVGPLADGVPSSVTKATAGGSLMAQFAVVRHLSDRGDLREAAANLFRMLRELDNENLDLIVAQRVPEQGIGAAINDRLQRAAS